MRIAFGYIGDISALGLTPDKEEPTTTTAAEAAKAAAAAAAAEQQRQRVKEVCTKHAQASQQHSLKVASRVAFNQLKENPLKQRREHVQAGQCRCRLC